MRLNSLAVPALHLVLTLPAVCRRFRTRTASEAAQKTFPSQIVSLSEPPVLPHFPASSPISGLAVATVKGDSDARQILQLAGCGAGHSKGLLPS